MFRARNSAVFDSDVIARDLVQPGMPALREITNQFGGSMLTASGELDRPRMRERVFRDPRERQRLEAILHPRVREALLGAVRQCTQPYCLLVIPLLIEVRADYDFIDRVLVTDVSPQVQVARLMQRDRCSADEASASSPLRRRAVNGSRWPTMSSTTWGLPALSMLPSNGCTRDICAVARAHGKRTN